MISLGQRIKDLRMKKGLTQVDLADGICTPSMISQIESDRARPSYRILNALAERLDVPLEKLLDNADMNLEFISSYKMAKAMVAAKEYMSAIPLLVQVLETSRKIVPQHEIEFALGTCYVNTGQFEKAEKLLNQVQDTATLRMETHLLTQTLNLLGLNEYNRKRYSLALHHWEKALEQVEKIDPVDIHLKACILNNLGDIHDRLGMVKDAVSFYSQASALYENAGKLNEIATVYMGLAQSYKRLNDLEKATEYSERAISIFEGLENVYMGVKVQVNSAIVYGKSGREEEAIRILEQSISKLQELRKTEDVGMAYVEMGKVQLLVGNLDEAEVSCRIARSFLPELHLYQAWVNRILGKVELQRGKREEAIRRFRMAADCFKSVGEIGEWENTMTDVSEMKRGENDFESAYQIMMDVRTQTHQLLNERGIVL